MGFLLEAISDPVSAGLSAVQRARFWTPSWRTPSFGLSPESGRDTGEGFAFGWSRRVGGNLFGSGTDGLSVDITGHLN